MPSQRAWLLACVIAVAPGCRQVFGIEETTTTGTDGPAVLADAPQGTTDATIADATVFSPDMCPPGYDMTIATVPGSRYRRIQTDGLFVDQHADCNDDLPNMTHLLVIDTMDEGATAAGWDPGQFKYVGAVQAPGELALDSGWYRFTGAPIVTAWSPTGPEPDDAMDNIEDGEESLACIVLYGNYFDVGGQSLYRAICECDGLAIPPVIAQMIAAATE